LRKTESLSTSISEEQASTLDDNPKFIELIGSILSDKAKEKMSMDQTELLHEETIYAAGFALSERIEPINSINFGLSSKIFTLLFISFFVILE
jgi:hypothetical protein